MLRNRKTHKCLQTERLKNNGRKMLRKRCGLNSGILLCTFNTLFNFGFRTREQPNLWPCLYVMMASLGQCLCLVCVHCYGMMGKSLQTTLLLSPRSSIHVHLIRLLGKCEWSRSWCELWSGSWCEWSRSWCESWMLVLLINRWYLSIKQFFKKPLGYKINHISKLYA